MLLNRCLLEIREVLNKFLDAVAEKRIYVLWI